MDFRAQFIKDPQNGLLAIFNRVKSNPQPDDPIEINAVGIGLQEPAKLPESQLPAVFFGYGDARRLEGNRFTDSEAEQFTVNVYATVNRTGTADLIDRQGAMRMLMDRVREEVRALTVSDEIFLKNVVISSATVDRSDLAEYALMTFGFTYIYEYE